MRAATVSTRRPTARPAGRDRAAVARGGSTLLQLQRSHGNRFVQRLVEAQAARIVADQPTGPLAAQQQLPVTRIQRQGIPPTGGAPSGGPGPAPPPGTALSATNCTVAQASELAARLGEARRWVNDAERKIWQFFTHSAPTALAWTVHTALQDNFHYTTPAHVADIAVNFSSLRAYLNSSFPYECVSQDWCSRPSTRAYVRGLFAPIRRLGDINICPAWFACQFPMTRTGTLIHERAHQYPGATDQAYADQAAYATLTPEQALDNADS